MVFNHLKFVQDYFGMAFSRSSTAVS